LGGKLRRDSLEFIYVAVIIIAINWLSVLSWLYAWTRVIHLPWGSGLKKRN